MAVGSRRDLDITEVTVAEYHEDNEETELVPSEVMAVVVEISVFGDVVGMGGVEDPGVFIVFAGSIDFTVLSDEAPRDVEVETREEEEVESPEEP